MDLILQLLANSMITGSIYGLCTIGLSLSMGQLKIMNFAHGHQIMLGGYLFYFFFNMFHFGFATSLFGAIALGIIIGILIFTVLIKPFLSIHPLLTLVSTLALGSILESIVSIIFGVDVKSLNLSDNKATIFLSEIQNINLTSYNLGEIYLTNLQILIITIALIILPATSYLMHSTSLGRKIRALSIDAQSAQSLGIEKDRTILFVLALSSVLTTISGILIGLETNLQPTMGDTYTIKAFAILVVGGISNLWGAFIAAFLLGIIENFSIGLDLADLTSLLGLKETFPNLTGSLPSGYKDAFAYVLILIILLFKPNGLFSKKQRTV